MAVPKGKRSESGMEFIYNARNLQIYTIKRCTNFPKRYTFYISQQIADIANHIHHCVKLANSIYPTNQHEVQMRRDYFLQAKADLHSFISQIEVAAELFQIEPSSMHYWMDMVYEEIRLVKGMLKSDKERYKNLP